MQSSPELYVSEGALVSHKFFHLTLQEYLAATHISNQKPEEQTEHFYCSFDFNPTSLPMGEEIAKGGEVCQQFFTYLRNKNEYKSWFS